MTMVRRRVGWACWRSWRRRSRAWRSPRRRRAGGGDGSFTGSSRANTRRSTVAVEKGYYSAAGLTVKLAEGSGAKTALRQLAAGQEQVVWGPVVNAAQSVSAGVPARVIALYQPKVPIGLIAHPDTPLRTPKDLEGKKLAYSVGETVADLMDPFFRMHKIDRTKLNLTQMDTGARVTQFMTRRVDLISVFTNNDLPELEKKAGVKFNLLRFSDFGLSVPGAGFMTSEQQLKDRPESCGGSPVDAPGRGVRTCGLTPEEAATIISMPSRCRWSATCCISIFRATVGRRWRRPPPSRLQSDGCGRPR